MKRFIRTIAGKTTLFMVCLLSTIILAGCIVGICLYISEDIYFISRQDIIRDLASDRIRNEQYSIVDDVFRSVQKAGYQMLPVTVSDMGNHYFMVTDENEKVVAVSETVKELLKNGETRDSIDWIQVTSLTVAHWGTANNLEILPSYEECIDPIDAVYHIHSAINMDFPFADYYSTVNNWITMAYSFRYAVYPVALVAFLLALTSFVALMCSASRRPDTEAICPGPLNVIPFDVLTAVLGLIVFFGIGGLTEFVIGPASMIAASSIMLFVGTALFLGYCISIASRLKQHNLLTNTVIFRVLKLVWRVLKWFGRGIRYLYRLNVHILKNVPIIWKTVLIVSALFLLELIILMSNYGELDNLFIFFLLKFLIAAPLIFIAAINLRRLEKAGKAMAAGDIEYRTSTAHMLPSFKAHADNLNSISDSIALAVNERMKSERMKTELITNVSHDIKTPLTSIISYADLIGREHSENPKINEYAEVLVRQSSRLKRLIEDLVEASKASTGNLEVDLQPCDAAVFLSQADGEYEEKLAKAQLTLVTSQPEKEVRIMADGRRMWRIFDNLMNNICKYALAGTRVYLSLEEKNGNAVITFKNTSRDALNMSEEELMERFTRGDASRNTEGNGLGLSIARSMAELQNGSLNIVIDGDLFKAVLEFPVWR